VSGSDSEGVEPEGRRSGTAATGVHARSLSRPAIIEALRAGHAYIRTRGVTASPEVEVAAVAADGRRSMVGDTVAADAATVTVTVRGGQGQLLQVSRDGSTLGFLPVPITSDPFTYSFPATRQASSGPLGSFYRVDTADLLSLTTIGGPVFLAGPGAAQPGSVAATSAAAAEAILPATGASADLLLPGMTLAAAAAVAGAAGRRAP